MDFYNDPSKVNEYEKMCDEYDGSELYNVLDKHLEKDSTLLELGCGPGNDIVQLKNKYKITGSDFSDEFLKRCRKKFPDLPFIKLDAVTIEIDKTFDCLFSNKVLHHLPIKELEKSLGRQKKVIKQNGIFAHTFWLGDKEITMEDMLFIFHNKENLLDLVSQHFEIVETYIYKEFEEEDSIFIIAKNSK